MTTKFGLHLSECRRAWTVRRSQPVGFLLTLRQRISSPAAHAHNARQTEITDRRLAYTEEQLKENIELSSPIDGLRKGLLGPKFGLTAQEINDRVGRILTSTNDKPVPRQQSPIQAKRIRKVLSQEGASWLRGVDMVRFQLKAVRSSQELERVLMYAFRSLPGQQAVGSATIQYILDLRIRENLSPVATLQVLSMMYRECQRLGLIMSPRLVWTATIAAARNHNPTALRYWFDRWRQRDQSDPWTPSAVLIEDLIKALASGARNASGRDISGLKEIILGFEDASNAEANSIRALIYSGNWTCVAHWISLLGQLNLHQAVVKEWAHMSNPSLAATFGAKSKFGWSLHKYFISTFFQLNMPKEAWSVFACWGGLKHFDLKTSEELLANLGSMPSISDEKRVELSQALVIALSRDLGECERALGVHWVRSSGYEQQAHHEGIYHSDPLYQFEGLSSQSQLESKPLHNYEVLLQAARIHNTAHAPLLQDAAFEVGRSVSDPDCKQLMLAAIRAESQIRDYGPSSRVCTLPVGVFISPPHGGRRRDVDPG